MDLTEEEEKYWMAVSAIFEGREASGLPYLFTFFLMKKVCLKI
jgi:hypothetical protein